MGKLVSIKVYLEDKEILKKFNKGSIAQAIHSLLFGEEEEIKATIEAYLEREIKPYINRKLESIEESINTKLDNLLAKANR